MWMFTSLDVFVSHFYQVVCLCIEDEMDCLACLHGEFLYFNSRAKLSEIS